jgi:CubicO group peptidase (beta-lactamase class C family)
VRAAVLVLVACGSKPQHEPPKPPPDPNDLPANVDAVANDVLASTGVPSASVACVQGGKVVYTKAYGDARLDPKTPATPQMRYSIGSISKQFTAVAILLLAEDGKLSVDDPVGKYVPGLTRGDVITIRQVLSHTSGYQDYAPQDYMIPEWEKSIKADAILERWARRTLDFEPGTRWQYSNTNFVIAGLVVEKVAGMSLFELLNARVFGKLGMASVTDSDAAKLTSADPQGYFRRAHGPAHPAPHEGPGWMYAAGELAMTAEDLAKWDISVIDQTVLSAASYRALETEVQLANGAGTGYALGVGVGLVGGRRQLRHSGEVSGFVAQNVVLPDDKIAVVVLTNQDASDAAGKIANRVRDVLLRASAGTNIEAEKRVKKLLADFAKGELDRSALTANASTYFTADAVAEYKQALGALGELVSLEQTASGLRGGMTFRVYTAKYADKSFAISVYEMPDGKLEQFLLDES